LDEVHDIVVLTAGGAAHAAAAAPTVSSTTQAVGSVLEVIQSSVARILQQYVNDGSVLDIDLSTYASFLADTFYDLQESRSADGTVAVTDSTFAELAAFVRRNVEIRRRRTSL